MSHTCYGCDKKVNFTDLRYECLCTDKKGVCKTCVENNVKFTIPAHHNLEKLHDNTAEHRAYFDDVTEKIGFWNSMTVDKDGNWVFSALYKKGSEQGSVTETTPDNYLPDYVVKTLVKPPAPEQMCTCCR